LISHLSSLEKKQATGNHYFSNRAKKRGRIREPRSPRPRTRKGKRGLEIEEKKNCTRKRKEIPYTKKTRRGLTGKQGVYDGESKCREHSDQEKDLS